MSVTLKIVQEELNNLDESLEWATGTDRTAAYFTGSRFLSDLNLDPEVAAFAAQRLGEIQSKYRLN